MSTTGPGRRCTGWGSAPCALNQRDLPVLPHLPDIRRAALTIAGCVERLDRDHLKHLDPDAFDVQLQARIALADHIRDPWEQLKTEGKNPAVKPEYQPLAALLDLLTFLGDHAAATARPVSRQA